MQRFLWFVLFVLAIGIAAYGFYFIAAPDFATSSHMKQQIADRPLGTYSHFFFGPIALILGAWQFWPVGKLARPKGHRSVGQLYVLCCLLGGTAALWMAFYSQGGLTAHLGFAGLAIAWLATTMLGYWHARQKRFKDHQRWIIRSYAMTCSAITLRIQLGIYIPLMGFEFQQVYPLLAWSCWVPNLIVAEWIVRRYVPKARPKWVSA